MIGWWNEGAARLLRRAMEEQGLSAPWLARKVGVTDRTVRNWTATGRTTHPTVRNLHDLCAALGMTPDAFRDAAAAHERGLESGPPASPPADAHASRVRTRSWRWLASIAIVVLATIAWLLLRPRPQTFSIPPALPGVYDRASGGDVSPDGTQIAFLARSVATERWTLFVHSLKDGKTRPLPQTEGNYTSFFWHSDSRSIFFIADLDLMRVRVAGGTPERVGHAPEGLRGTVNRDGVVILGSRYGLMRIDETGNAVLITKSSPAEVAHSLPFFLPDQRRALFTITRRNPDNTTARILAVVSINDRSVRRLFAIPSSVQYTHGQLLYVRNRTLFARPFDSRKLEWNGPERAIAAPVWCDPLTGEPGFSSSATTLVVIPPARYPPLYHLTSAGGIRGTLTEPPDIRMAVAAHRANTIAFIGRDGGNDALWLYALDTRQLVKLAAVHGEPTSPVFSRDDRTLYYAALGKSWAAIYSIPLDGRDRTPHLVIDTKDIASPRDVSPDGKYLVFQRWTTREGNLWYMPVDKPEDARPLVATQNDEGESARISHDGRQLLFVGKRDGIFGAYITDFPPTDRPERPAMQGDGWRARWSADGKHIYFARRNGVYEADPLTRKSRLLFTMPREISVLEPSRDGGFFIRETPITQNPTVATQWWRRLAKEPLNLSLSR